MDEEEVLINLIKVLVVRYTTISNQVKSRTDLMMHNVDT